MTTRPLGPMTRLPEYLLDTNAISAWARKRSPILIERLIALDPAAVCTSVIVAAELHYGLAKRGGEAVRRQVEDALTRLAVLPFAGPADRLYGELRATLESSGAPIGNFDMLIAAHALALDLTLVTGNEREFRRVPGLRVENWLEPQART